MAYSNFTWLETVHYPTLMIILYQNLDITNSIESL